MSRTVWTDAARAELRDAITYISKDSPENARVVLERLSAAAERLAELPTGRISLVPGVFEKVVPHTSYLLIYSVARSGDITILQLIHMARDRTSPR